MPTPTACGSSPRVRGKRFRRVEPHPGLGLIPACAGKTRWTCTPKPVSAAHPRVCGENLEDAERIVHEAGSSPRVRGKPLPVAQGPPRGGLIPACAGKTRGAGLQVQDGPAHPRVCGENALRMPRKRAKGGSSPRVRGKRRTRVPEGERGRLIPACAGKTAATSERACSVTAHPRVCGENLTIDGVDYWADGSSPRVRGKHHRQSRRREHQRLIPACAGKTSGPRAAKPPPRAHPRVCGENRNDSTQSATTRGSSPRVRGKRRHRWRDPCHWRLIPACAGKTARRRWARSAGGAHPRVCGENPPRLRCPTPARGSSPRVRGKRIQPDGLPGPLRLIPACAGKTRTITKPTFGTTAHPRVCGENQPEDGAEITLGGSSPRVRGKPVGAAPRRRPPRLIPACAGKTLLVGCGTLAAAAHPRVCGENTS